MQANRGVTFILLSLLTRLGSPKDVLTLQPNWPLFFTGETVTLRCLGQTFKHYGFTWYRNGPEIRVLEHTSHENIYTIAPVTEAHSGEYTCSAESGSDRVRLNVSALPKATLTVEPKRHPLYNAETVTLRCEVDSNSNWTYSWYKDQTQMDVSQTAGHSVTGNRLTIPGAAGSDMGQYWCEGKLEGREVTSQRSDSINLTVAALPKPTLEGRNVTSQPSDSITLTVAGVILSIALGVGFCLIVLALIFILFQKHRSNKGLPCLAWSRSDSSVHTQASAAVGTQPYTVDQATGLSQAAGPICEPLYSQANVTNQKKKRKEAGGHEDVVCSVLGLQDQKSKNTPTEGCDNVVYSIVALEDQKKKKRKEKNTQKAGGCEDVVYSGLTVNQKRMKKNTDEAEGANDVVYSTLALEEQKKKKKEKNNEKAEGGNDVVYSTLALEDQKKEKKKKKKKKKKKNTANGDADVLYSTVRTGQREQHWLPDPPPS